MSTVVLDTITGKSTATTITIGSTPVVSASANSMTIRGEGSNQTSIQQGVAKMWIQFDGTGTIGTQDAFNRGGLTDNGTGDFTVAINNDMSNANYSCQFNGNSAHVGLTAIATGSLRVFVTAANDSSQDVDPVTYLAHGDLA